MKRAKIQGRCWWVPGIRRYVLKRRRRLTLHLIAYGSGADYALMRKVPWGYKRWLREGWRGAPSLLSRFKNGR